MSQYGSKYQIQFVNQERNNLDSSFVGVTVDIGIYDRSNIIKDTDTQIVYSLTAGDDPLHLSSVDNSEDKFTPIRAIQATIKFNSDSQFSLATFTDQSVIGTDPGDPRWYVEIKIGTKFIFKGFLVLDDCSEDFMPDPNVVVLTATDGLGWLKDIPLTTNGDNLFIRETNTHAGAWISDSSGLTAATQLELHTTDLGGAPIDWVTNLQVGDQVRIVLQDFPTINVIYQITGILPPGANNNVYTVTLVSGTVYTVSIDTYWYINKVGSESSNPTNYHRIANYLSWALQKTGLNLNLRAVFNIRDAFSQAITANVTFNSFPNEILVPLGVGPYFYIGEVFTVTGTASNNGTFTVTAIAKVLFTGYLIKTAEAQVNETVTATFQDTKFHFFDKEYLDAKTFEDQIGTCINCYDVISRILGEMAFLTQRAGEWWIVLTDEIELNVQYSIATFAPDGALLSFVADSSAYGQFIQKDLQHIIFSGETTQYTQQSQSKFIKETYKFEYPLEIPCNSDFSRGTLLGSLPNEPDENGNDCTVQKFNLDCWTMKRGFPLHTPIANDSTDYIKRLFNSTSQEVQRYVVLTFPSANDVNQPYIQSEGIPVSIKDKLSVTVDYRFPTSISSGSGFFKVAYIVLLGDDGSYWIFGRNEPGNTASAKWYDTTGFTINTDKGEQGFDWATTPSGTDWQTQSWDMDPMPVSGNVFIWLHAMNFNAAGYDDINIYYQNLSVTYIPYINGSYTKYSDIYAKVSRSINFRASRDKQVYISDGIKKLFKGALFIKSGSSYSLVNQFFNWKAARIPTSDQIHSYLHLQAFDVWNQYRNVMKVFHGTMQGLNTFFNATDGELAVPSCINTFYLQDGHPSTINRRFLLLTFDQDFYKCEWRGTFAEVYKTDVPKAYEDTDTLEIKYE